MPPSSLGVRQCHSFDVEQLGVSLVEVLYHSTRLEPERLAEPLHRGIRAVRGGKQLAGPGAGLNGCDKRRGYALSAVERVYDEQVEEVVFEKAGLNCIPDDGTTAFGDDKACFRLRTRQAFPSIAGGLRKAVEVTNLPEIGLVCGAYQ